MTMWKNRLLYGAWLLAAAVLYFFENNTGTRAILAASLLLPAVSVCCAAVSARRLSLVLNAPEQCAAGNSVRVYLNAGGLLPLAVFCGKLCAHNRLTGERLESTISLSAPTAFELPAAHCGMMEWTLCGASVRDLFGLCRFLAPLCGAAHTLVFPQLFPMRVSFADGEAVSAQGEQWSSTRPGFDPSETFAIREYAPGDPIRQIHWKLSSKTDTLMLRELGLPVAEETLLLLDGAAADGQTDAAAMDAAVTALLSLSHALAAEGTVHSVCWRAAPSGALQLRDVSGEACFAAMRKQLLATASAGAGEDACTAFYRDRGGLSYAHTVVCAPSLPAGLTRLCCGNRVTLLLSNGGAAERSGVHVTAFSAESMARELSILEI